MAGGEVLFERSGPGTNPSALAPEVVQRRLARLLAGLPRRPAAMCIGAAGSEVPEARARLEKALRGLLPGTRIEVVHDSRLVLPAAGLEAGIVLISGTGSIAYAYDSKGREARAGGWGWLLGDAGSGAWLAREAAREVMRRSDDGESRGAMGQALLKAAGAGSESELEGRLLRLREPRRWAALAHVVFDTAGADPGANRLVEDAAAALAGLVATVQSRLPVRGPVVLSGGLVLGEPLLEAAVRRRVKGDVRRLEAPPVEGAVKLALARASLD